MEAIVNDIVKNHAKKEKNNNNKSEQKNQNWAAGPAVWMWPKAPGEHLDG